MRRSTLRLFALALCAFVFQNATAQSIVGITTDDKIFTIGVPGLPNFYSTPVAVTGMGSSQELVGIDFRPNTGELYALGYVRATGDARLYTINPSTGVATTVGAFSNLTLGNGSIGFDFNPTVDRIRVVGSNGNNYRLHPVTGAIAATDGSLAYAAGDQNFGTPARIGGVAYANSYIGTETTTLYDYDEQLNIFATQNPPNAGVLNTLGATGIVQDTVDLSLDLDIYFDPSTKTNTAYLVSNDTTGFDALYTVNLTNGATTAIGTIGLKVKNIAVTIDRTLPPLTGELIYGLTRVNRYLISFDSDNPSIIRDLYAISGITTGQVLVGMDFRPATLELLALGYNSSNSTYQLYKINQMTGAATAIGASGTITLGSGRVGFDFNPTVDRIRVTGGTNANNFRMNPNDGTYVQDVSFAYVSGDPNFGTMPYISTVAYLNSFKGATATGLYAIDDTLSNFVKVTNANGGTLITRNSNWLNINQADPTVDLDVYYDGMANKGYIAANVGTSNFDNLYTSDTNGNTMLIGSIGYNVQVQDIAVRLTYVPQCATTASPATNLVFKTVGKNLIRTDFVRGNGSKGVIVVASLTPLTNDPVCGIAYNDPSVDNLTAYTSATSWTNPNLPMVGNGKVVYKFFNKPNILKRFTLKDLPAGARVYYYVYEYDSTTAGPQYNTSGRLVGDTVLQLSGPTQKSTNLNVFSITTTSATINWTPGNGDKRIVTVRNGPIFDVPVDGMMYNASAMFGNGDDLGNQTYVVYNATGSIVTVDGLMPNTQYRVNVIEYNQYDSVTRYSLGRAFTAFRTLDDNIGVSQRAALSATGNNDFSINLYPNPAHNEVRMSVSGNDKQVAIRIVNVTGQTMISKTMDASAAQNASIDISNLAHGMYLAEITVNGTRQVRRLVKD